MKRNAPPMAQRAAFILCILLVLLPTIAFAQQIVVPTDQLYAKQWALEKIGAECAWQHTTGSRAVTVAVVDSGVDMSHPDLRDHLRHDGYDFVDDDDDPRDENGHGTHVTGIIAAAINDAGTVGLAPNVSILPIRVMTAEGDGDERAIALGISYAARKGAKVINLSLGATLLLSVPEASRRIVRAIEDAQAGGALVVVAAGNDFVPLPNAIVGADQDVLVVAASNARDVKSQFSNSGPWVDVVAPGERILSTMPTYEVYLTSDALPPEERFQQRYDFMSGTSQATPYVSALAALLFSLHPDWDAKRVTAAIKDTAEDIYPRHPDIFRRLKLLGSGRISACAALGGPIIGQSGPLGQFGGIPGLILGVGVCLLVLTIIAATVLFTMSRRRAAPAPQPGQAPQLQPQPQPGVYQAPPQQPQWGQPPQPQVQPPQAPLPLWGQQPQVQQPQVQPPQAPLPQWGQQPQVQPPQPQAQIPQPAPADTPTLMPQRPQSPAVTVRLDDTPQGVWGRLLVVGGPATPRAYPLSGAEVIIGRADDCAVLLQNDGTVSRRHARITLQGNQATLEDLQSSHGTALNGQPVRTPVPLNSGDAVRIGQTELRFER